MLFEVWKTKQEFLPLCWRKFASWSSLIQGHRGALGGEDERKLLFGDGVTYAGALVLFANLKPSAQQTLLRELLSKEMPWGEEDPPHRKPEHNERTETLLPPPLEEKDEPVIDEPKETPTTAPSPTPTEEEAVRSFIDEALQRASSEKEQPTSTENTVLSPYQGDPSWTPLQLRLHKGVLEKYKNWRDGRDYAERMSDAWGVVTFLLEKRKGVNLDKKKSSHNSRVKSGKLQPGEDTLRWTTLTDVLYGLGLDNDAYTIVAEMFPLPAHDEPHPELLRGMTTYPVVRISRMGWGSSNVS